MSVKLYSGYIRKSSNEIVFRYSDIEVLNVTKYGEYETKHHYFLDSNYSSRFISKIYLDKPLVINYKLTVFYSESKDAVYNWLNTQREEMIEHYRSTLNMLEKSQIDYVMEEN